MPANARSRPPRRQGAWHTSVSHPRAPLPAPRSAHTVAAFARGADSRTPGPRAAICRSARLCCCDGCGSDHAACPRPRRLGCWDVAIEYDAGARCCWAVSPSLRGARFIRDCRAAGGDADAPPPYRRPGERMRAWNRASSDAVPNAGRRPAARRVREPMSLVEKRCNPRAADAHRGGTHRRSPQHLCGRLCSQRVAPVRRASSLCAGSARGGDTPGIPIRRKIVDDAASPVARARLGACTGAVATVRY